MNQFVKSDEVVRCIEQSTTGKNTKFLKQSHSLWYRFGNYETNPPFVLYKNNQIVSIIFATTSQKTKYINLYEICTIQGHEGKGYATEIWSNFISYWYGLSMQRIKLSCTPSSITWHLRNGLVFWSVDKQGSLRSDQPLQNTITEQNKFREQAVSKPIIAMPDNKVCEKLRSEDVETLQLSSKKMIETYNAIQKVGKYWLRPNLFKTWTSD